MFNRKLPTLIPRAAMQAEQIRQLKKYCNSLVENRRLKTREANIGGLRLGGDNPIRVQSMTTTDTMDTQATVEQSIRMIEAGCELVRITAPSRKEAENLKNIRRELHRRGYTTPLVADIHFTPNAAEIAARIVEKVRVNPGNYADKKKFQLREYTDEEYNGELERIYKRFSPLVKLCKAEGTAMRIGTNHGSLSDRIMSRYGDSPEGMVASALEFVDICEDHGYHNLVISMKASNTRVMVQAYRLLVHEMLKRQHVYPLHLGVTEAGDGADGRIKSAIGIGALLADGLGDTVRVSLTEPPEAEMPVGYYLVNKFERNKGNAQPALPAIGPAFDPFNYERRTTRSLLNLGSDFVPRVVSDFSHRPISAEDLRDLGHYYSLQLDKWHMTDQGTDFLYTGGHKVSFMLPNGLKALYDAPLWQSITAANERENTFPVFADLAAYAEANAQQQTSPQANFVFVENIPAFSDRLTALFAAHPEARTRTVLVLCDACPQKIQVWRNQLMQLIAQGLQLPVVICNTVEPDKTDQTNSPGYKFAQEAAADLGPLLVDGLIDGVWLKTNPDTFEPKLVNETAFGILQASRARMTKTEYISCPSCGRTLFDLEETTAKIRSRTDHLKGVKIGIMGCIVNGPGEMADADYGYVGSGPGKITLYRGQDVVRRNVPTPEAVDALIEIIDEDGNWIDPPTN